MALTKIRQVLAMMMAALLCFALTPMTAFAEGEEGQAKTGTITIDNAVVGETYAVYKMLDLSYNGDSAYSYTVDSTWAPFFENGVGANYVDINDVNGTKYVTWKAGMQDEVDGVQTIVDPKTLTDAALQYAEDYGIAATGVAPAESTSVVFSGLTLGYYLVKSTVGTVCSITTTDYEITIQDKNDKPTVEKQVKENLTGRYGKTNDASVGKTVEFRSTIDAKLGALNYVYHDKMSTGLDFDAGSVKVLQNNEKLEAPVELATPVHYSVNAAPTDGCTFEITFTPAILNTLTSDDELVIEYSATLTADAVITGAATNEAQLTYGDTGETEWSFTTTRTWEIPVFKYTDVETPLAGAVFALCTVENDLTSAIGVTVDPNDDTVYVFDEDSTVTTITTDGNGKFKIKGLDSGIYYLTETIAPEGYNKMAGAIKIEIAGVNEEVPGAITMTSPDEESSTVDEVKVENKTGSLLPSTGGIGTVVLYVIGAALVLVAIVVLVRRRNSAK